MMIMDPPVSIRDLKKPKVKFSNQHIKSVREVKPKVGIPSNILFCKFD